MTVKVKYIKAQVEVSDAHTQQVCVAAWELPILTAMHTRREEGPAIVEEIYVERDAPPEARSEYARLEQRYGRTLNEDGSRGAPWVAAVYGSMVAGNGNQALIKAIRDAVQEIPVAEPVDTSLLNRSLEDLGLGGKGPDSSVGG